MASSKMNSDELVLFKIGKKYAQDFEDIGDSKSDGKYTLKNIKERCSKLQEQGQDIYLHQVLEDSTVILPSPEIPERNPELEARIQKLKAKFENDEYRKMVANVSADRGRNSMNDFQDMAGEVRMMQKHMWAVVNFVLTVGGSFAFAYKAIEYSLPFPAIEAQVLGGLFVAIVVAIADLYFLLKHV